MEVHLVDGTYELFRHFFAMPSRQNAAGLEVGATRGVLTNVLGLLEGGVTHIAVATDHVVESFRNELWDDYKDGSEIDPDIAVQFGPLEEVLAALGVCVWPMVEFEADDGLAAGAALAAADTQVEQVLICTPDKDLAQCVGWGDGKVVQWDRRKDIIYDTAGVQDKYGVLPESIPDYLALVGDSADGFPGLRGWGAKSAAAVLARYVRLDDIPASGDDWDIELRGRSKLAMTLAENFELAELFRTIATVRPDAPVAQSVEEMRWVGPTADFAAACELVGSESLLERAQATAEGRS